MENNYYLNIKIVKDGNKVKKKLTGIIFTRACCSLGIIINHYFAHSNGNFKFLYNTANSSFGFMFVTTFFCISGAVLYYNYPKIKSIKKFYYKRWKSIFPSFYICFLIFYIKNVIYFRKLFYNGHWSKLFISIIGLDGYLKFRIKTYYLIGEWFLGAIIIFYIIYPLLSIIIAKKKVFFHIFIVSFYILIFSESL